MIPGEHAEVLAQAGYGYGSFKPVPDGLNDSKGWVFDVEVLTIERVVQPMVSCTLFLAGAVRCAREVVLGILIVFIQVYAQHQACY